MKVLVTGSTGQLGKALKIFMPNDFEVFFLDKDNFDLTKPKNCINTIDQIKPDWIINAGAFTNVDNAEENEELALKINSETPFLIAKHLESIGSKFIFISTDFVFNGKKINPYKIFDEVCPINAYGRTKASGEKKCLSLKNTYILRTSWVYGNEGKNFLNSMYSIFLNHKRNHSPIRVVNDQIGCPTNVYKLASVCWKLIQNNELLLNTKILHWSDGGETSWYEFASEINELLFKRNLLENKISLVPIPSKEYKRKAVCPNYSKLDSSKTCELLNFKQNHWKNELKKVISNF